LGLKIVNKNESEDLGFKVANLKRGNIFVELMELERALSPKDFISSYNQGIRIKGLFKTGFLVSDFEKWMDHFNKKGVLFHGNVVTDELSGNKMVIILDPDGNYIQIFEK
jgi:hypothetical protein